MDYKRKRKIWEYRKKLTLLTFNGMCEHRTLNIHPILNQKLKDVYQIKMVKNFMTFSIKKLGINVLVYARGGFKITIANSLYINNIISGLDKTMNYIINVLELFYRTTIVNVTINLTQLAFTIKTEEEEKRKISYSTLLEKKQLNEVCCEIDEFKFVHIINWMILEDGNSNYYFSIYHKLKKIGGLKLYNNLKTVLFMNDTNYLDELETLVSKFIKKLVGPQT